MPDRARLEGYDVVMEGAGPARVGSGDPPEQAVRRSYRACHRTAPTSARSTPRPIDTAGFSSPALRHVIELLHALLRSILFDLASPLVVLPTPPPRLVRAPAVNAGRGRAVHHRRAADPVPAPTVVAGRGATMLGRAAGADRAPAAVFRSRAAPARVAGERGHGTGAHPAAAGPRHDSALIDGAGSAILLLVLGLAVVILGGFHDLEGGEPIWGRSPSCPSALRSGSSPARYRIAPLARRLRRGSGGLVSPSPDWSKA